MVRVELSLVSHTNVGKTTLARTLLRRDIGEISDRAHVTDMAESDVLIESAEGDTLVLWDTPGFGDSARLLGRLKRTGQPLGWFLAHVWDRFADRPFWCGQQALRTVRDNSDVILYIVNASERPTSAAYVAIEMEILGWLGKPVIVLLNQLGPPGEAAAVRAEVSDWENHAREYPCVRAVLPFDAFARCWVQEGTLFAQVQRVLAESKNEGFGRLREEWTRRNLEVFEQSMHVLARQVAACARDVEPIATASLQGKARSWIAAATSAVTGAVTAASGGAAASLPGADAELARAERALATRLDSGVRSATAELVRLHGLTGSAAEEVLKRMGREFLVQRPADADKASVLGGLVSGALGGLAADLGAGGLTFGAGAVIGGVLGAVGARGLAKAYNLARGSDSGTVRWSSGFLSGRLVAALMRYLAVAHFGRGRGAFVSGEAPARWLQETTATLERRRDQLEAIWAQARSDGEPDATALALFPVASAAAREVLAHLYPDCASMLGLS